MIEIPLHDRYGAVAATALIDEVDEALVRSHTWHKTRYGYAQTNAPHPTLPGKRISLRMHRLVMGLARGDSLEVDHVNRNRLDNRRSNLRVATRFENAQNVPAHRNSSSVHRGVTWHQGNQSWEVRAMLGSRSHHLGSYKDEDEAGRVAAAWRAEHAPFSEEYARAS